MSDDAVSRMNVEKMDPKEEETRERNENENGMTGK